MIWDLHAYLWERMKDPEVLGFLIVECLSVSLRLLSLCFSVDVILT